MRNNRGRDKFRNYRSILVFLSNLIRFLPLKIRVRIFGLFQNTKGILGIGLRYVLIKSIAKRCGDNVLIHRDVYIYSPENLKIGDNVSIHPLCYIDASGGISIHDNVSIAHGGTILSTSHEYDDLQTPIKYQPISYNETRILSNVWIGCKATILYGVTVNSGSIVGANALVTKNVEENTIVGGVPAKKIKKRV